MVLVKKILTQAMPGEIFEIIDFADISTKCQATRFGLSLGEIVKCLANIGPVIVGRNKQEVAIGKKLADKIFVKEVQE